MCVFLFTCVCVHAFAHVHTRAYCMYMCVCVHVCICIHMFFGQCTLVPVYVFVSVGAHICTYVHSSVCVGGLC